MTDTNAASDSKGRTWAEGNLICGLSEALEVASWLLRRRGRYKAGLMTSFVIAVVPAALSGLHLGLRQGKPARIRPATARSIGCPEAASAPTPATP